MFRAPHAPELAPQTPARHKPSRPLCDVPPAYWPTPGSPECDRHAANRPHAPAPAVDRAAVCIGERDSQIGDEEEALSLTLSQFYHPLAQHKSQYVSRQIVGVSFGVWRAKSRYARKPQSSALLSLLGLRDSRLHDFPNQCRRQCLIRWKVYSPFRRRKSRKLIPELFNHRRSREQAAML